MADFEFQQNSDVCTACSGNGKLLCCDGCWRAFHFTCFDPPLEPRDAETDDGKWFCYKCRASRSDFLRPERAVFGELGSELNKKNPVSFNLPYAIRDYFEGVKTGDEGEYEEASVVKANRLAHSIHIRFRPPEKDELTVAQGTGWLRGISE